MSFLNKSTVHTLVIQSIQGRKILEVEYQHIKDGEVVFHRIAPFDIGSTNPKTAQRYTDTLWAYSFTHEDKKTGNLAPRVCGFDINSFISIDILEETFDALGLAKLNLAATGYDYRGCSFAIESERDWFI